MSKLLEIKNLHVNAEEKEILKGINLNINKGEIHVIMGPNGSGKTTTANAILNNPEYTKTEGKIIFDGQDITDLFYDGTLSEQIAAGTFDDIFVGDYITGKNSNRKY